MLRFWSCLWRGAVVKRCHNSWQLRREFGTAQIFSKGRIKICFYNNCCIKTYYEEGIFMNSSINVVEFLTLLYHKYLNPPWHPWQLLSPGPTLPLMMRCNQAQRFCLEGPELCLVVISPSLQLQQLQRRGRFKVKVGMQSTKYYKYYVNFRPCYR